ncbi:MAG: ABC transporter substrate-binding protein, partial [Pseudomonadota bacterium]
MHGVPALGAGFSHFPHADPNAQPGGGLRLGVLGAFDSLNPFTLGGSPLWAMRRNVVESLMARNFDEPFSLYGLLAEAVALPDDRSWVAFRINPAARFSDGAPVTVDDVIFSFETLRDKGRPNHRFYYGQVDRVERLGPRAFRFVFKKPDRELP